MNCAECGCPTDGRIIISGIGTLCSVCREMLVAACTPYFFSVQGEYREQQKRLKELAAGEND